MDKLRPRITYCLIVILPEAREVAVTMDPPVQEYLNLLREIPKHERIYDGAGHRWIVDPRHLNYLTKWAVEVFDLVHVSDLQNAKEYRKGGF